MKQAIIPPGTAAATDVSAASAAAASLGGSEPAGLIASRVIFALLVSVSLVLNLLLLLAVIRRRRTVHVIYALSAAFLLPDIVFYAKLVVELVDWGADRPAWARSDWSCGLWQVGGN